MSELERFRFAVDSALLGELGEKLVSTVHVAVAELVKNAYDADASKVTVSIVPEADGAPRVIVEDDGIGMTIDEVRRFWMKIGTTGKVAEPVSKQYGRLKTGSKGIGRFSCRRLGLNLRLSTTADVAPPKAKRRAYQRTRIEFNWNDFMPGVDVETVECSGETSLSTSGAIGTRLEIWGGISDEWQMRGFNYLQRQLAILTTNREVARPGYEIDPGFNVILNAPGLSGRPIDLRDAVIEACWGTVTATVGPDGRAICRLNAKGIGGTKTLTSKQTFTRIKGAELRVGILPTRKEEARKPSLLASYVLGTIVSEWGGIHVRLNGFRVFPYGDPGDDWLRIDADRGRRIGKPEGELFDFAASLDRVDAARALITMLGMRNYLGQVDVTSRIDGLIPRIDRQGFLDNEVFDEVRRFARFAIDWANIHRDHFIRNREHEEAAEARKKVQPVLNLEGPKGQIVPKAASYLRQELKRIVQRLPSTQQKDTERTLVGVVRAIETTSAENYKQLEHLRLVASASTLTLLFAHEVRTMVGTLGAAALRLDQLANTIPEHRRDLASLSTQIKEAKQRFDNLIGMTGIVGAFRKKDAVVDMHLRTAIERATRCFHHLIFSYKIVVDDRDVGTDLTVGPMIEGELYTILLNILSNSVKSVIASDAPERRIRFEASQEGKKIRVRVMDNGLGLDTEFFDDVFTPFLADPSGALYDRLEERANPEDAAIFGTGSGLGLPIARDVARSRGGDLRFVAPPPPWKACVILELP